MQRLRSMAAVTNTAQLVPQYTSDLGETAANVLHFLDIGGDFDQDTGDYILNAWLTFWKQLANEGWSLNATASWRNLAVDPPTELVATCTPDNGDGSGDHLPASCAAVLSLHTGSGGRRGRGRIFIPGIGDGDAGGSVLAPAFITLALDEYEDFATDIAVNVGYVPAVYSRTDGVARVIQATDMDGVIDSQRRRAQRLA